MEILYPEWLKIVEGQQYHYGYNQAWYTTNLQKTRGCGPTAAAQLLAYLSKREAAGLVPIDMTVATAAAWMEEVWRFITPGYFLGLNSTKKFQDGMTHLLAAYQLPWECRRLSVPLWESQRPAIREVVAFVQAGLALDCPVAFLNLHKGKAEPMQSWHWTILTGITDIETNGHWQASCYDEGRKVIFDLDVWLSTTRLGGGFAYLATNQENNG